MSDVSTAKLRIARKATRCTECRFTIAAGVPYVNDVLKPWHECSESKKYLQIKACLRCVRQFGLAHSGIREQFRTAVDAAREVTRLANLYGEDLL